MGGESGTDLYDYGMQVEETVVDPIASEYMRYARKGRIDSYDLKLTAQKIVDWYSTALHNQMINP